MDKKKLDNSQEKNFVEFRIENNFNSPTIQMEIADTFFKRFIGLMGRKKISRGHGLLISPCNSIHMLFMRFAIDVVYLDENFVVKKIVRNLPAWIGLSICFGAKSVVELAAGEVDRLKIEVGQKFSQNKLSPSSSSNEP